MKQVGLVGFGSWGRSHARILHGLGVLRRIVDSSPIALESARQAYPEIEASDSFDRLLGDSEIHGIVITTSPRSHAELALRALRAGKDVLVEKPMALTLEQGERLVIEARALKRVLMVGHVLEYHSEEPLLVQCRHFLECIETRREPLTSGANALGVLRILDSAQRSVLKKDETQVVEREEARTDYFAHPTASIDPSAEIGSGCRIWHNSHVMADARLGKNCRVGQNVIIANNVICGDGVKIQNNVSVYEGVVLEDYVFCGPSMVFTNVLNPRSEIERKSECRKTFVRRGATLGANCTIVCGNEIGRYAFVGAGAVVVEDVPDFALVVGNPARWIGWVCRCAEGKLQFDESVAECRSCGRNFKRLGERTVIEVEGETISREAGVSSEKCSNA